MVRLVCAYAVDRGHNKKKEKEKQPNNNNNNNKKIKTTEKRREGLSKIQSVTVAHDFLSL